MQSENEDQLVIRDGDDRDWKQSDIDRARESMSEFCAYVGLLFDFLGGINYVEVGVNGPSGKFTLLIQREGGRTPAAMYAEQLAENARLQHELSESRLQRAALMSANDELQRVVSQVD